MQSKQFDRSFHRWRRTINKKQNTDCVARAEATDNVARGATTKLTKPKSLYNTSSRLLKGKLRRMCDLCQDGGLEVRPTRFEELVFQASAHFLHALDKNCLVQRFLHDSLHTMALRPHLPCKCVKEIDYLISITGSSLNQTQNRFHSGERITTLFFGGKILHLKRVCLHLKFSLTQDTCQSKQTHGSHQNLQSTPCATYSTLSRKIKAFPRYTKLTRNKQQQRNATKTCLSTLHK